MTMDSTQRRELIGQYLIARAAGAPGRSALLQAFAAGGPSAATTTPTAVASGAATQTREPAAPRSTGNFKNTHSGLLELIHTPLGFGVKNGARVAPYAENAHYNHVHVAAGPKTVIDIGNIAEKQFGLTVRENPHWDKVDPVHVNGSYHYKNQAIDVSGDAGKMKAFAQYVARLYGIK